MSVANDLSVTAAGAGSATAPQWRLSRSLLRMPLFGKILIANALIVALVAVLGAALAVRVGATGLPRPATELIALIAFWGIAASVVVNGLILRIALLPLKKLEETARRVEQGDLDARVEPSDLADRNFERIVLTFNAMLDGAARYRQRLRDVAARALTAAESERKRIALELHDGTAQQLAGLRVRLRLVRNLDDQEMRNAQLDQVSREIAEAIDEVRRMARNLRPQALDVLGLAPAIESHARSLSEAADLSLDLRLDLDGAGLAPEVELALYRILQEALSNVVRHSGASTVRIGLSRSSASAVELSIEDDGAGFHVERILADQTRGLGLLGMHERAGYIGGSVDVVSTPGRGTRIVVRVPGASARLSA
jgi:two-component system, NarL family, sensor histidine kinase UhpB